MPAPCPAHCPAPAAGSELLPGEMGASAPVVEVARWHGGHAEVSQAVLTSTKCLL